MTEALNERTSTRREMIELLKQRLRAGEIKAMEMRLLDDLLTQEAEEPPDPGALPEGVLRDLPFVGDNLIVGGFTKGDTHAEES